VESLERDDNEDSLGRKEDIPEVETFWKVFLTDPLQRSQGGSVSD